MENIKGDILQDENIIKNEEIKEEEKEEEKVEEKKEEKKDEIKEEKKEEKIKDKKKEEEEKNGEEKKEASKAGERIRNKLLDRLNKARARSCDKKDTNDTKSQNILIKAQLLEKVLGKMKTPEDLRNNRNITTNGDQEKESIKDNSIRDHSANIHVVKKKKKKKNMIPFNE